MGIWKIEDKSLVKKVYQVNMDGNRVEENDKEGGDEVKSLIGRRLCERENVNGNKYRCTRSSLTPSWGFH